VSSIDVDNDQLAEHLASPDFFDAANHPEVSFVTGPLARDGSAVTLEGTLEVKGNRAPVTLTGTIADPVADPWGNSKLGLSLEGSVDKNAVGLTWNAPLPEGGSMLADEVSLTATLVFVQPGGESE
jgi:polyisoprenoid-binding protein YceI